MYRKIVYLIIFSTLTLADEKSISPKIGLVLSGGGAKGFAHVGVLKVLDSLQINIDYIAATSFGAITGSLYAIGKSGKELEKMGQKTNWDGVLSDLPPRNELPYFRKKETGKYQLKFGLDGFKPVTPTGFIQGQTALMELSQWYHEYEQITDFSQFPIPFKCVAMDLITGNQVIMDSGSLTRAVRSSFSIPTIFAPVEWGDSLLIDGGVINNLPVDIVKEMGADIVIAVNVSSRNKKVNQINNIIDVLEQSISVHEYELEYENESKADIVIRPDLKGFSGSDFNNEMFLPMVKRGYEAATLVSEDLKKIKSRVSTTKKLKSPIPSIIKPIINSIEIKGYDKLPFNFLYRLIGYEKGDIFNSKELERRINDIYSLGYFNTIFYEIEINNDKSIKLTILISEKPMREFNTGLRWDDKFGFIGALNIRINSTMVPGLVFEEHMQFAGIRKNILEIYYPSRTLDLPIYPFLRNYYEKYDIFYYDKNVGKNLSYMFESNGFGIGLGFLLKNYWTTEIEIRFDDIQIIENYHNDEYDLSFNWKKNICSNFSINLDTIDDVLMPSNGINFNIDYEINDSYIKNDFLDYAWYSVLLEKYSTFNKHTYLVSAFYQNGSKNSPLYKNNIYNYHLLTGFDEKQFTQNETGIFHFEYRFKHKKDIFLKFLSSNLFIYDSKEKNSSWRKNLMGYGFGITFTSPVGPLELVWSRGPKSIHIPIKKQNYFKFNAGYKF